MSRQTITVILICAAILLSMGLADARDWQYEYPVSSGGVAGLWASIAKDSSNVIHVAYVGHGKLTYATKISNWIFDVANTDGIASGEAPQWVSLAMAGTVPHISYYDARTKTLKHAWKSGATWQSEIVDSASGVGKYSDIAANSSGYPAVIYYDEPNNRMKYAYKDGSGWHIEVLATGCGRYSSLTIDSSGYAHVSYYDSSKTLRYAKRTTSWSQTTVDSGKFCGEMCSIALNSSGNPHIAYRDGFNGRLRHAWKDVSGWHVEVADSEDRTGFVPSIAVGTDGYPRIMHYRYAGWHDTVTWTALETKYSYKDASGWHSQMIQRLQSTNDRWAMSMVLDSSNLPCVAYHYSTSRSLSYMYYTGSSWSQQIADQGREIGEYASLALDGSDNPHISYYAMDDPNLFYARKSGPSWYLEQVDTAGDTGGYSSIELLPNGYPAIAYCRFITTWDGSQANVTSDLRYAYRDSSGWHPSLLQSSTGQFTSLAITSGRPCISYCDLVRRGQSLRFAEWNGSSWSYATPDAGSVPNPTNGSWHSDGFWSSIGFDASGNPHISYMETWEQYASTIEDFVLKRRLKHAWRSGGSWYSEIVEDGDIGRFTSIAINASGYPCIAYQDVENGYLKYAYWTGSAWVKEAVDTATATGFHASLALNSSGYPSIAYKDVGSQTLRYAWKDASGWHTETADNSGRVGDYCSLEINSAGNPYIVYMDWDNLTLKTALGTSSQYGAITGYVRDDHGTALAGASVTTSSVGYSTTSGADGSYVLSNVTSGTYSITASESGYQPQTHTGVSVTTGQTTVVNFALVGIPGAISGFVQDSGGNPVAGATISTSTGGYTTTSGANGAYTLDNVYPGTYSVTAARTGYISQTKSNITVTSGQTSTVNFSLTKVYERVAEVKRLPDGQTIVLANVVCSRRPSSALMFVQDSDRTAGIKVTAGAGAIPTIDPGTICTVTGLLRTVNNVRELTNVQVTAGATDTEPNPIAVGNRDAGGADFYYSAGPPVSGQIGTPWGTGPNNVSLLVETWGRVVDTPVSGVFHIHDGGIFSGLPVKLLSGLTGPPQGSFCIVRGLPEPDGLLVVANSDIVDPLAAPVTNPGFEADVTPVGWTPYGHGLYVRTGEGYGDITPHSGDRYAENAASWSDPKTGGLYQQITVRPGVNVTASAWAACYGEGGGAANTFSRIGVDPTGGTDPASGSVQWGTWYNSPADNFWSWTLLTKTVWAVNSTITVFLDIRQDPMGAYAWPWQVNAFDDVSVTY